MYHGVVKYSFDTKPRGMNNTGNSSEHPVVIWF